MKYHLPKQTLCINQTQWQNQWRQALLLNPTGCSRLHTLQLVLLQAEFQHEIISQWSTAWACFTSLYLLDQLPGKILGNLSSNKKTLPYLKRACWVTKDYQRGIEKNFSILVYICICLERGPSRPHGLPLVLATDACLLQLRIQTSLFSKQGMWRGLPTSLLCCAYTSTSPFATTVAGEIALFPVCGQQIN